MLISLNFRQRGVKYYVEHHNETFYILTNDDGAFNSKIVSVPVANTSKDNWKELVCIFMISKNQQGI